MLLNHNVEINKEIYHIQTEKILKNSSVFSFTQIFLKGSVIWSSKKEIKCTNEEDINNSLKSSHKNAILYLKDVFTANKNLDFMKLKTILSNFKEEAGEGLLSIDIFTLNSNASVASYNSNSMVSNFYGNVFSALSKKDGDCFYSSNLDYSLFTTKDNKSIFIGKIKNTDLMYGMLLNTEEIKLGLLLNVLMNDFVSEINDCVTLKE